MQLVPGAFDLAIYLVGWTIGWLLLWRPRPIPTVAAGGVRQAIAVVIPARDEANVLPYLIPPLVAQLRNGDQLVVIDDHSTDGTGTVAASLGATVVVPPELPVGWLGKPHACSVGAGVTTAPHLLFLDADVRPAPDLLDRVGTELAAHPDAVVSAQPWHTTGGWAEQASVLCNVTALMGCGAFTAAGDRVNTTVAFGPVLAVDRSTYDAAGGHAHPNVRAMHTEDIGLARTVGRSRLFTGGPDTSFRMYPDGLAQTIRGWTRSIATGARFTTWWLALATLLWVWSLAGGWLASPLLYPLSALQVWVLSRRAASVHPVTALLFPIAVAAFVVIFVRSLFAVVFGRQVAWKGRTVAAR